MLKRSILGALLLVAAASAAEAADDPAAGDIRNLKVGLKVADLPEVGYVGFACGGDGGEPPQAIAGWREFRACPADASGLREVVFEYDDSLQQWAPVNDDWEGTKIAGHPVRLSILVDGSGIVRALRAVTNAQRAYMKKKAFLLGIRVMGRYGRGGWTCSDAPAAAGRTAVGGLYIDRHCEKALSDRTIFLDTDLYREPGQEGEELTGATRLEIRQRTLE